MKLDLFDAVLIGVVGLVLLGPDHVSLQPSPAQTSLHSWEGLVGQGLLDVAASCRSGAIKTEREFYDASAQRSKDAFNLAWEGGIAKAMAEAFPKGKDAQGNDVSSWTAEKAAELYERWGKEIVDHAK